jgi:hypothetical protein
MMRTATRAVLAAALLAVSLAPMGAQARVAELMYFKTYYSDATLTTVVGFRRDGCNNGRVSAGPIVGSSSPYYLEEAIGTCPGGYW